MKICPQCNKSYDDETLNFCLEDGSALSQSSAGGGPPPTVMMPDPRESVRQNVPVTSPRQDEIRTAARYDLPEKTGSKAWLWVLGIVFGVMVLCGGGFIGLVAFVPFESDTSEGDKDVVEKPEEEEKESLGDPSRKLQEEINLADWDVKDNDYIRSELRQGDLVLTSVNDYYYVVLSKSLKTYDASTSLTVRNITGEEASSGFGLVIHSYPTSVLEKGYALLIRSDNGTFRIVKHSKKKEQDLVKWRKSDAIKRGSAENHLEIRVDGRNMEFFINGESVRKLRDSERYKDGVAGIYTSDDIPIAYSKLELRK